MDARVYGLQKKEGMKGTWGCAARGSCKKERGGTKTNKPQHRHWEIYKKNLPSCKGKKGGSLGLSLSLDVDSGEKKEDGSPTMPGSPLKKKTMSKGICCVQTVPRYMDGRQGPWRGGKMSPIWCGNGDGKT